MFLVQMYQLQMYQLLRMQHGLYHKKDSGLELHLRVLPQNPAFHKRIHKALLLPALLEFQQL